MNTNIMNSILAFILYLILQTTIAWAGFAGPSTIIQGNWGSGDTDFGFESGDTMDSFPGLVVVDEAGNVIIGDGVNSRIKIYDSSGNLQKSFSYKSISPGVGWPANLRAKATKGIFSIYEKLQKYDYGGNLVWAVVLSGFEDFWIAEDGGVWVQEYGKSRYNNYSPTGQLIKTSAERPLELGRVQEESLGYRRYKTTVTYEDATYTIISEREYERFVRDNNKKLYAMNPGIVEKFSLCGKLLGQLEMPKARTYSGDKIPGEEVYVFVHEEYGAPVVDIHGNVYTWKRTPDNYAILKWTWVDDPNVPSGPDAPTGLSVIPSTSGLYLTWTASPQDPGCVTGYEIARATSAGGVFSTVGTVEKGVVKYNDTTAAAGTTYYYKVRAAAGTEYSIYTAEVSGKR